MTRQSVLAALAEHDDAGEVVFLEQHGFDSGEYFLVHEGKRYASMHVDIEVASEEERNRYFKAFQSDPRVKYVL